MDSVSENTYKRNYGGRQMVPNGQLYRDSEPAYSYGHLNLTPRSLSEWRCYQASNGADVLLSQLPADRILRIFRKRMRQSHQKSLNKILVPINVKSTHWYLGVLQRQESGEFRLLTQNNCMTIRSEKAENNLRAIGKTLSCPARKASEVETPIKH